MPSAQAGCLCRFNRYSYQIKRKQCKNTFFVSIQSFFSHLIPLERLAAKFLILSASKLCTSWSGSFPQKSHSSGEILRNAYDCLRKANQSDAEWRGQQGFSLEHGFKRKRESTRLRRFQLCVDNSRVAIDPHSLIKGNLWVGAHMSNLRHKWGFKALKHRLRDVEMVLALRLNHLRKHYMAS